jgi:WASH complex subunit CCDC53
MQPHVDYTEVAPVPHQLTLQFINNFVINTGQFLNKFALTCDDKLREVHNRIQRLEITMNILDAKLNSIEGLSDVRVEASGGPSAAAPSENAPPTHVAPIAVQEDYEEPAAASGGMKNKDDPRYARYFKMLFLGVALANVQNKMMLEGVDPSILEYVEACSKLTGGERKFDPLLLLLHEHNKVFRCHPLLLLLAGAQIGP